VEEVRADIQETDHQAMASAKARHETHGAKGGKKVYCLLLNCLYIL
jgi:hypothetical protein